jgi:rubredoxin
MESDKYPADWERRRHAVFKRDQWECQGCGLVSESGDGLHAHHVKPISKGGGHSLDNLLTLCGECHTEVHSSGQELNLTPVQTYPCAECDDEYVEGESVKGSFCSERCWLAHKATKALDGIEENGRICATCFANFPKQDTVCPNCGNWNAQENHRDELDDVDLDLRNLVATVIQEYCD